MSRYASRDDDCPSPSSTGSPRHSHSYEPHAPSSPQSTPAMRRRLDRTRQSSHGVNSTISVPMELAATVVTLSTPHLAQRSITLPIRPSSPPSVTLSPRSPHSLLNDGTSSPHSPRTRRTLDIPTTLFPPIRRASTYQLTPPTHGRRTSIGGTIRPATPACLIAH